VRLGDIRLALAREAIEEARDSGDEARVQAAEEALRRDEVAEYRRRVDAHPTDPSLRFLLGGALYRVERLDDAIGEFQQSVKDPRRRVDSLVMLGQAFYRKGHLDLARSQLEKALESIGGMNQRAKDILYNLGTISEKQGRREDAAEFFKKIYEVDIGFRDVSSKIEQLKA
jgi:tetratricopeptide (TPR) repeat protein